MKTCLVSGQANRSAFLIILCVGLHIFALIGGATSSEAIASSCEPVDLRGPALGPARDQGLIGWCYAFAVADLLSHHTGQRVSAGALAVNYEGHRQVEGGFPSLVLENALSRGFCPIERFNIEGREFDDERGSGFFTTERLIHILNREIGRDLESHALPMIDQLSLRRRLEQAETLEQELRRREQSQYFWQRWLDFDTKPERERVRSQIADLTQRLRELDDLRCQDRLTESPDVQWITPLLTILDRMEISAEYVRRESIQRNPNLNLALLLAQRVCQPLVPVQPRSRIVTSHAGLRQPIVPTPPPRPTAEPSGSGITTMLMPVGSPQVARRPTPFRPRSSEEHLDHTLSAGRPLIITYNVNPILREGSPRYQSQHASTLVGRRLNPESGQCEYLLRNSWGEACEADGRNRYRFPCEKGHIWVPRDVVLRMQTEFISLEP